jgi:DNA gyrase subunit A
VIRFPEGEVTETGRTAQGVRGIKLSGSDRVVGGLAVRRDGSLCLVTEKGFVHRVALGDLTVQKRDGLGLLAFAIGSKTGKVVAAKELLVDDELMVNLSTGETVRLAGDQIDEASRGGSDTPLVRVRRGESIVEVTRVATREESRDGAEESGADEDDSEGDSDALQGDDPAAAELEAEEGAVEDQYDLLG